MAQKTLIQLTDDLDGKPIADGDGDTVSFGLRGQNYEIDLSNKNLEVLDKFLRKYVEAARKVAPVASQKGRGGGKPAPAGDVDTRAVRAWAEANGVKVNERGRLSADVVKQYKAATAS